MSIPLLTALFVLALVISIFLNYRYKVNIGLVAMSFAYLIGSFCLNMSIYGIIDLWPVRSIFGVITIPMFFSFPRMNGTMEKISKEVLYIFRRQVWALPMVFWLVSWVIGAVGTGITTTTILTGTICFPIGLSVGLPAICVVVPVVFGATAGSLAVWSGYGVIAKGILSSYFELPDAVTMSLFYAMTVLSLILTVLFCLIYKGFHTRGGNVVIEKPAPFNPVQKKTFIVMLVFFFFTLGPQFLKIFSHGSLVTYLSSHLDIQLLSAIFIVVCMLMNLADMKAAILTGVPWSVYTMVGGMSMLLSLMAKSGVTDAVATWIASSLPLFLIPAMLCVLGGILSCFSGAISMAFPLLCSMAIPVAVKIGLPTEVMAVSICMGCTAAATSPFGAIGSLAITLCPDESEHQKLTVAQLKVSVVSIAIAAVLTAFGFWALFA
ncbi:MAG: hypothetical protein MJ135_03945 [Oscillospiraceae bacterium]|nr:hypothetical protein [Oscillospiraceae bacterium]